MCLAFKFCIRIESDLCTATKLQDSIFVYVFTFTRWFCFFLPSFPFDGKDSLKYFLQGRSNDVKLSQLLFIWESFNFCFIFLKDNFASYSTSGWQYFSFSTLKLLCHSTLACKDSDEKFVKSDFYVFSRFSL